jgi:hypothetical protein
MHWLSAIINKEFHGVGCHGSGKSDPENGIENI